MTLVVAALAVLFAGGVGALLLGRRERAVATIGTVSVCAAAVLGGAPAARALFGGAPEALRFDWSLPLGSLAIGLDGLSAFFVLPILLLAAVAALASSGRGRPVVSSQSPGFSQLMYNLLVAGMLLVAVARNGVLFLLAWEVMSVASYFLVVSDDGRAETRRAGWTYLVAAHIGTACLLALFLLLGRGQATLDFEVLAGGADRGSVAGAAFLLALVGFGTKAGLVPLHTWLPEAHPAAPSHVSAVMSGVMIKTGVYGLLRMLSWLDAPPPWAGWVLLGCGALSALYGVLFALAQGDLKRLLAYSSVENIGLIVMGIGLGVLGLGRGEAAVAVFGFGGALLHAANHALFKGLLFLAAGSAVHAAHTHRIDRLGGLLRRMPVTGGSFAVGSASISALPPLNGFVGEAVLYLAAFAAALSADGPLAVAGLGVITVLALTGGLAAACFTKAFGVAFLGEPRSDEAAAAREAGTGPRAALSILAGACVLAGFAAPLLPRTTAETVRIVSGLSPAEIRYSVDAMARTLRFVAFGGGVLVAAFLLLAWLRRGLLARRRVSSGPTWDCGYAAPSPRMQYTGSSYAQPLTDLFDFVLHSRREAAPPAGPFPDHARFASHAPDPVREHGFAPAFAAVSAALQRLRPLQGGKIQLYVLYIALVLLILLAWKLG